MTSKPDGSERSKLPLIHAPVAGSQAPPEQCLQSYGSRPENDYAM